MKRNTDFFHSDSKRSRPAEQSVEEQIEEEQPEEKMQEYQDERHSSDDEAGENLSKCDDIEGQNVGITAGHDFSTSGVVVLARKMNDPSYKTTDSEIMLGLKNKWEIPPGFVFPTINQRRFQKSWRKIRVALMGTLV